MKLKSIQAHGGLILAIIIMVVALASILVFKGDHYLAFSFACLIASMLPFYWDFEVNQLRAREIVFLAVLATVAAVARVPFAPLPSVQPTSFIIIVSALALGKDSGFIIGSTAAIVSNLFLGQGPWTPWQMFCWGMMGVTAGIIGKYKWSQNVKVLCVFGFAWGFIFGWIMDLWYALAYVQPLNMKTFIAAFVASAYFDLAHALSNVFFIALFYKSWYRIIMRFKQKYGLLDEAEIK
ncbi:ECF transporter S component [Lentilactobacillus sp. Marseille-Q4993]|uniref:ECF transporter S component n=1 Tax=Lentilactobacillus sp. Marseille-Q4993 TaxID=3039492 RepID=UPI0024BCAACB|nr:ECF transporter S component [Lentilactobacillus sp. Marseille-Q4993]